MKLPVVPPRTERVSEQSSLPVLSYTAGHWSSNTFTSTDAHYLFIRIEMWLRYQGQFVLFVDIILLYAPIFLPPFPLSFHYSFINTQKWATFQCHKLLFFCMLWDVLLTNPLITQSFWIYLLLRQVYKAAPSSESRRLIHMKILHTTSLHHLHISTCGFM